MTAIWGSDGGQWHSLAPVTYPAEAVLHDLVQEAPQMLPLAGAPRLTVLGREVRLGANAADLLAVESSGRMVIIEVKLAGNGESRRAVVAQVLSYAGYLQGLDPDQLESEILARTPGAAPSVLGAVEADDQQHAVDPSAFREGLARSLADGSFRLVIVLDSAPDELVQVVGYLQLIAERIQIDLVTVTAYDVGGSQALVPQRVEPARRVRELSDAQSDARQSGTLYPGSAEFRAAIADTSLALREPLERLAGWADALDSEGLVKLVSFRGRKGITTLLPRLASDGAGLVSIAIEARSAYMQFWRSVFERRAPQSITAVQAALGAELRQGNATHSFPEPLLEAIAQAYREAAGRTKRRIDAFAPHDGSRLS